MEWVETTGKTVEEALDTALDQLGVDEADAEFEVVEAAKVGLFGRVKSEARIRARVRPTAPPSKDAANNNRRRRGGRNERERPARSSKPRSGGSDSNAGGAKQGAAASVTDQESGSQQRPKKKHSRSGSGSKTDSSITDEAAESTVTRAPKERTHPMTEETVPLNQQGEVASDFLSGLLGAVDTPVNVAVSVDEEDEIISVAVDGDNLGHLIGPKGATLQSLQELTRTVVQRQTGARNGRVVVDVGQYREKRREALERFSRKVAEEVIDAGGQRILEPMNPADRKIIHDLVNSIDGVSTSSEGEEPRRRVVISSTAS